MIIISMLVMGKMVNKNDPTGKCFKSYVSAKIGVKKVLDDGLEIPSDKSVGILGRNGAGKSTFMRLLSGTETPDVGRISMGDTRLWPLGTSAAYMVL